MSACSFVGWSVFCMVRWLVGCMVGQLLSWSVGQSVWQGSYHFHLSHRSTCLYLLHSPGQNLSPPEHPCGWRQCSRWPAGRSHSRCRSGTNSWRRRPTEWRNAAKLTATSRPSASPQTKGIENPLLSISHGHFFIVHIFADFCGIMSFCEQM